MRVNVRVSVRVRVRALKIVSTDRILRFIIKIIVIIVGVGGCVCVL